MTEADDGPKTTGVDDPTTPVALEAFPSPAIAELIVQMLLGAGIPAYVEGTSLADDNAVGQMMLGALGRIVYVRRGDLEKARALLAENRAAGKAMDASGSGEA